MAPNREAIQQSSVPHPDFLNARKNSTQPPPPADLPISALRAGSNAAKESARKAHDPPAGLKEWEITIPLSDGTTIPAWVYGPSDDTIATGEKLGIFLFFHGGGWCLGNRWDDFHSNRITALKDGVFVVCPEYRLAPENPFPKPVEDGIDALKWVASNASKVHASASTKKGLIVGGTSAGGNIACAVVHHNLVDDAPAPVTGQFLSVPVLFSAGNIPEKYKQDYLSAEQNKASSVPPAEMLNQMSAAYNADSSSPLFSPANCRTNHNRIPATYIQACGVDMVRDDALIYEKMLREDSSVPTRLDLYPGLPHHFWEFFLSLTSAIQQRMDDTVAGMDWLLEQGGSTSK